MKIYDNHPIAPHTTMHIGGCAKKFIVADSQQDLYDALALAEAENERVFILGAGSNLLVSDEGFDGTVIHPAFDAVQWTPQDDGSTLVTIEAGAPFDDVVAESCRRNLGGIEALSGIPGSAGGSLVQNIGAYGQEISEVFVKANAVNRKTLDPIEIYPNAMAFQYRHTSLKTPDNLLILTSIVLRLKPFDASKAIARCQKHGFARIAAENPKTAQDLRNMILKTRRAKGMCYDENDFNTHSVGSFFINPVVSEKDAQRHNAANIIKNHKPMPSFPTPNGVKLSAAWLIEQSELTKGFIHKGAALSAYHCLAIVNRQNATCADVLELSDIIRKAVFKCFRITLEPEVVYLTKTGIEHL